MRGAAKIDWPTKMSSSWFESSFLEFWHLSFVAGRDGGSVGETGDHPDPSGDLSWAAETDPEIEADCGSQDGWDELGPVFFGGSEVVAEKAADVDSDESDECSEVEEFGS